MRTSFNSKAKMDAGWETNDEFKNADDDRILKCNPKKRNY